MRLWKACPLCAGQPTRDHLCPLCQGAGGWSEGEVDGLGPTIDPDEKLAAILGITFGGFLAYLAYIRGGFGGDRVWDFVIPIGGAFVVAKVIASLPRLLAAIAG